MLLSAIFCGDFWTTNRNWSGSNQPGGILENKKFYSVLDKITNLFRAIPFIILVAFIAPITKFIVNARGDNGAHSSPSFFSYTFLPSK